MGGGGGGGFSVNETLDKSLKCRVLNQLFSSSGRVASTTRFCMSVGRLVSRYVGLSVKKMSKNVEKIKICRKCKKKSKKMSINVVKCHKMSKDVKR